MTAPTGPADLLTTALEAAVPLWIEQHRNTPDHWRRTRAAEAGAWIAEHGDDVLYRSKRPGRTAYAFNKLAEGLACAAFQPGGVRFAGLHFEAAP